MFVGMGWEIAEGPEVEAEWFNFDALNFDADHPARQMQDTFFVDPPERRPRAAHAHLAGAGPHPARARACRSTSSCPGRVFRTDELDATHTPVFHQVEGLAVDEGSRWRTSRAPSTSFAAELFGDGIATRLRPSYFPFTEPSAEMDLRCFVCRGADPDCRTCKGTGWIEWGGCGMVNRNVLQRLRHRPRPLHRASRSAWASSGR